MIHWCYEIRGCWNEKIKKTFFIPFFYSHRTVRSREFFIKFKWSVIYGWVNKTKTSFEYSFKKNVKNKSTPIEFFRDYGKFKNQLHRPEIQVHIGNFVWPIQWVRFWNDWSVIVWNNTLKEVTLTISVDFEVDDQ